MKIMSGTTVIETTKATTIKEVKVVNGNIRKPNSTLVLCCLANYMVSTGICEANIAKYENAVKGMTEGIPGNILDIDGVITFCAGNIPENLADKPVLASFIYEMPVKHNLHVNTMGKNYYGISMEEARQYKVTNDLFFIVDLNAKKQLLEKCALTDNKSHLPCNENDIESKITDFIYNADAKIEIVSARSTTSSSSSNESKDAKGETKRTRTPSAVAKKENLFEAVVAREKANSIKRVIPRMEKLTLNSHETAILDVTSIPKKSNFITTVEIRAVDEDPGDGHFNLNFEYPVENIFFKFNIASTNPMTGVMTLVTQREITETEIDLLIPVVLNPTALGYTIHNLNREKEKFAFIWNSGNYSVMVLDQ